MKRPTGRTILVVDDEPQQRAFLRAVLEAEGVTVQEAGDGTVAVEAVSQRAFDLVLMDLRMKQMDGLEALAHILDLRPEQAIVIMTAFATVKTAVEAMKVGARDYLPKPIGLEELRTLLRRIWAPEPASSESHAKEEERFQRYATLGILTKSLAMVPVLEAIDSVASTDATVLLTGESGVGKGLIATAIHLQSPRTNGPLVKVNCGALTESLLESELFGIDERVATGVSGRMGKFELANGGTIFLDEIGDMSLSLQVKVLNLLQDREFMRVGGNKLMKTDVRVVAATNRDLEALIAEGKFRQDLFYRLNVVSINVPPLRDRPEDLSLFIDHFVRRSAQKNDRDVSGVSPEALQLLLAYHWPGNVRELENAIERAVIMSRTGKILPNDLPLTVRKEAETAAPLPGLRGTDVPSIKEMERELIVKALQKTGGNRTEAARILGIGRRTLQYKLKEYDIS